MADKFEIQNQYQHFGFEKRKNSIYFDIVVIIQMFVIRFLNNTKYNQLLARRSMQIQTHIQQEIYMINNVQQECVQLCTLNTLKILNV